MQIMESMALFKALSDPHRMRIVCALGAGPLCVCHFEEIVEAEQVKVSKQLRYLKEQGVVKSERVAQWMVYSLAHPDNTLLTGILSAMTRDSDLSAVLEGDRKRREAILARITQSQGDPLDFLADSYAEGACDPACCSDAPNR